MAVRERVGRAASAHASRPPGGFDPRPLGRAERRRQRGEPSPKVVLLLQGLVLVGVVAVWEVSVRAGWVDPFFWSRPGEVWEEGRQYLTSREASGDVVFTLRSTLTGFVVGNVLGSAIGLSLWWSRLGGRVIEPLIVSVHAIPKLAFAPLFVIIFGLGTQSKVAMVVALTVVTATLSAHAGVKAVDPDLVALLNSLGASRWQTFRKVILPSSTLWILAAMRLNIGLALTGAIVGEMVGSREGLGRMIFHAGSVYNVGRIWVGALLLAVLALVMYGGVGWVERRVVRGFLHTGSDGAGRPVRG